MQIILWSRLVRIRMVRPVHWVIRMLIMRI